MTFGIRLRQARERKGFSQETLGKGLGVSEPDVSKQTVYGWEKDSHSPTARQLALICQKLDQGADWLLFGKANQDMKSLSSVEAQLVVMLRALSEPAQDEVLEVAHERFAALKRVDTPALPWNKTQTPEGPASKAIHAVEKRETERRRQDRRTKDFGPKRRKGAN